MSDNGKTPAEAFEPEEGAAHEKLVAAVKKMGEIPAEPKERAILLILATTRELLAAAQSAYVEYTVMRARNRALLEREKEREAKDSTGGVRG